MKSVVRTFPITLVTSEVAEKINEDRLAVFLGLAAGLQTVWCFGEVINPKQDA